LASEASRPGPDAKAVPVSPAFSAYTVEELHNRTAEEILQEGGSRKERSLRHFTINFGPQHPAAHGVLRLILELNGEEILRTDVSIHRLNPSQNHSLISAVLTCS
jgi:NADH dehydrogenase (ubiquinone) Fe-S protein 2